MKWLPIIRIEQDTAYVQTIRGIEPCKLANNFCYNAEPGHYALCKSIRSQLFMFDHSKNPEVKT